MVEEIACFFGWLIGWPVGFWLADVLETEGFLVFLICAILSIAVIVGLEFLIVALIGLFL